MEGGKEWGNVIKTTISKINKQKVRSNGIVFLKLCVNTTGAMPVI